MNNKTTRSPIVSVLGHVDHGKSSILDAIRGTNIVSKEAGAITQAIGASIIPIESIKKICGKKLDSMKINITIPGLLFIDTPGHAAFTNLRKRGGSLADLAILVVDINEGFKPQTIEAIEILKQSKTPFIVAANKLDLINGYKKRSNDLLTDINNQNENVKKEIETKIYELVGKFYDFGFNAERFDRVSDFTKELAIIPCSAKEKIGISELLILLTGLAQRFLENNLLINIENPAKGTILEVKETQGLGSTIDVIIYDGVIKKNDTIIIGTLDEPIITKVRALLQPMPLSEMRDKKSKFKPIKEAIAATGVKIAAPGLEKAISGMPIMVLRDKEKEIEIINKFKEEVKNILIETEDEGIIIKADTIGSLEAMSQLFKEEGIPIRKAKIGAITKKDIVDAEANKNPFFKVILGFNITQPNPAEINNKEVKIIISDIIYKILDDYRLWREEKKKELEESQLNEITRPFKLEVLPNTFFRQSNPAIFGVEVLGGVLKTNSPIIKIDGTKLGHIKAIEQEKKSINKADKGLQVAISVSGIICDKHIKEYDILLSDLTEEEFKKLKKLKEYLTKDEIEILKKIVEIKRKEKPVWGV